MECRNRQRKRLAYNGCKRITSIFFDDTSCELTATPALTRHAELRFKIIERIAAVLAAFFYLTVSNLPANTHVHSVVS